MIKGIVVICLGASFGAVLRYVLNLILNDVFASVSLGTLVANLSGGYLIGLAMGFFELMPSLDPRWQLFIITGFLGALTTFSSFSAEVTTLLLQHNFSQALLVVFLHLLGSLLMTFLGLGTILLFR